MAAEAQHEIVVPPAELEQLVTEIFERGGMDADSARTSSRLLVETNLWGIDSHGVLRVPAYLKRLEAGAINGRARPEIIRSAGALAVIDGHGGIGFVVGHAAMRHALALAEVHGIGFVGALNSNHFGAAGLYARLAADEGRIGIAMTNVVPNVVAPGASKPVIGNNPLAIAVPNSGEFPFLLDISCSAVSGGKLLLASKKGERIPLDWATDRDGNPTDDPEVGFAGFLLPMGGFKGLGLAYAVEILAGVVTGGAFGAQLKGTYTHPDEPSNTSHLMIAVNTDAILPPDEMRERMARFTAMIKSAPMREVGDELLMPGEPEHRCALRRAAGIPLPEALFHELNALAAALGSTAVLRPSGR